MKMQKLTPCIIQSQSKLISQVQAVIHDLAYRQKVIPIIQERLWIRLIDFTRKGIQFLGEWD